MDANEKYLRSQILKALNFSSKSLRLLPQYIKDDIADEGVKYWSRGGINGREAVEHAIKFARAHTTARGVSNE